MQGEVPVRGEYRDIASATSTFRFMFLFFFPKKALLDIMNIQDSYAWYKSNTLTTVKKRHGYSKKTFFRVDTGIQASRLSVFSDYNWRCV